MQWTTLIPRQIPWSELQSQQRDLIEAVKRDPFQGYLLVSEPSPTFTHGYSASPSDLLWSESELARRGIQIARADRGGKWTYHGPGQIVVFPIFAMESAGYARREVRKLLTRMRELTSEFLIGLGVNVDPRETPFGLYVDGRKLVSFGIAVHENIVSHGLALYYADPSVSFLGIRSCGVSDEKFTSLTALGKDLGWEFVGVELAKTLQRIAR